MLNWSDGKPYEKSLRIRNKKDSCEKEDDKDYNIEFKPEDVVNECLENNIMLDVINEPIFSMCYKETTNKREKNFEKMTQRDMIVQKNMNPFLSNNNYLDDIDNSNKFLLFSQEKEK